VRTHSGLVAIDRGPDDQILLVISVAEVGHPSPLIIAISAHEWCQILAHPTNPQPCLVHLDAPLTKKVG
jgi:hypothetical protein